MDTNETKKSVSLWLDRLEKVYPSLQEQLARCTAKYKAEKKMPEEWEALGCGWSGAGLIGVGFLEIKVPSKDKKGAAYVMQFASSGLGVRYECGGNAYCVTGLCMTKDRSSLPLYITEDFEKAPLDAEDIMEALNRGVDTLIQRVKEMESLA